MKHSLAFLLGLFLLGCQTKSVRKQSSNPSFPRTAYAFVKILSLDTAYLYTDEDALITKGLIQDLEYLGPTFVDKQGLPLHSNYREVRLNARQQGQLKDIFRPVPSQDSISYDKECMPIFRDVIVFYDRQNQPLAQVQLCFDCELSNFLPIKPGLPAPDYMGKFDEAGRFVELRKLFQETGIQVYDQKEAEKRNTKGHFLPLHSR